MWKMYYRWHSRNNFVIFIAKKLFLFLKITIFAEF